MKKTIVLLAILLVGMSSCTKDDVQIDMKKKFEGEYSLKVSIFDSNNDLITTSTTSGKIEVSPENHNVYNIIENSMGSTVYSVDNLIENPNGLTFDAVELADDGDEYGYSVYSSPEIIWEGVTCAGYFDLSRDYFELNIIKTYWYYTETGIDAGDPLKIKYEGTR